MTSDSWSKPVVMFPLELMQTVGALRPRRMPKACRAEFVATPVVASKLAEMLADSESGNHREDLGELGRIARQQHPMYLNTAALEPGLQQPVPDYSLVQLFPWR